MSLIMGVQYVMSHNYYNTTDDVQTLCGWRSPKFTVNGFILIVPKATNSQTFTSVKVISIFTRYFFVFLGTSATSWCRIYRQSRNGTFYATHGWP